MRFIREHLFYVILMAATLVVGIVAVGYYLTSDVGKRLASRTRVSKSLVDLSRRKNKVSEKTIEDLQSRIDALVRAAEKDAEESVAFNKQNLGLIKLNVGAAVPRDAWPFDEKLYNDLGLHFVFIKEYTRALNEMLAQPPLKRTRMATRDELQQEEIRLREQFKEKARAQAALSMQVKKAKQGMIFIEDDAVDRVFTNETKARPPRLWEAQVNLWVTQEILQAIIATNQEVSDERVKAGVGSAETNVLNSAIKRLVRINVNESFVGGLTAMGFGGGKKVDGLTGRTSTQDYAVIRYRFTVVMPTRHVERLLRNLMMRNYHTVVNLEIGQIGQQKTHYYGTEPVMMVGVHAEMLLLTKWVRPLMPPEVQARLPATR